MMTPAGVWEKWIYMVKRLVSISIPIVHHVSLTLRGLVEPAWTLLKGHLMLQDNYGLYMDIESTCNYMD